MALKIVNSESLDAVANAINESAGTTGAINFPDGFVEKIGKLGSDKLPSVISGTVTELTEKDFGDITSLRHYALYGCGVTDVKMPDTIVTINNNVFTYCSKLASIKLSNNLKTFGKETFSGCTKLQSIKLPMSLTTLGNYLFNGCSSLKFIEVPNGVTEIPQYMVYGCSSLRAFDLTSYTNNNFPSLANVNAFTNTHADMKIIVPIGRKATLAGMTNWSSFASKIFEFDKDVATEGVIIDYSSDGTKRVCSGIGDYVEDPYIVIPTDYEGEPILEVSNYAFNNNTKVVRVYLNNAERIGVGTFSNCSNLISVDAPNVKVIGYNAFYGAGILSLDLPNLVEMGSDTCVKCANLERANLGKVNAVTSWTFTNCSALKTLILPNTAKISTLQATNAFDATPIASGNGYIYVPRALIDSYKTATNWSVFANQFRAIEDYPEIIGG